MAHLEIEVDPDARLARLERIESEYRITLQVLAIVVETLLKFGNGEWVEISDAKLLDTPDLSAWRDVAGRRTILTIER